MRPPDEIISCGKYEGVRSYGENNVVTQLILASKFKGDKMARNVLIQGLYNNALEYDRKYHFDLITWAPKRDSVIDHAAYLAAGVSAKLGVPCASVDIICDKYFDIKPYNKTTMHYTILLIDDVLTTGTTVYNICNRLKKKNDKCRVIVLVAAQA